uniref:Uncharacterized protein n=1 Tax=Amphimedon queenslandica TaxID=400682 RepID=A0A1X7TPJ1_AMPQE
MSRTIRVSKTDLSPTMVRWSGPLFQPELLSSLCLAVSWPILGTLHPFIDLGVVNYHQICSEELEGSGLYKKIADGELDGSH